MMALVALLTLALAAQLIKEQAGLAMKALVVVNTLDREAQHTLDREAEHTQDQVARVMTALVGRHTQDLAGHAIEVQVAAATPALQFANSIYFSTL